jgi:branched-chain amino acid transport system permease protein
LFAQQIVNSLVLGSIYTLIALGFTLIFGVAKLLHMAHGGVLLIGAYVAMSLTLGLGLPLLVAAPIAIAATIVVGLLVERITITPLMHYPPIAILIATLGMSFFLESSIENTWGAERLAFPGFLETPALSLAHLQVAWMDVFILAVTVGLIVGLQVLVKQTRLGKAIRATAENPTTAGLMGVKTSHILTMVIIIGSALGAVGGMMMGSYYGSISPAMAMGALLKGVTAVILGGMGSVPGAIMGGFFIAFSENFGVAYVSSAFREVTAFSAMILILLIRPAGIFGSTALERRG